MMTNGAGTNGHHPEPPREFPEQELLRRVQGSPVLLVIAILSGGAVGSVGTYGATRHQRTPCAAQTTSAKEDCTCPTCPAGQACYKVNCTCVAVAAVAEMERKDALRRLRVLEQKMACEGGNLTEAELR